MRKRDKETERDKMDKQIRMRGRERQRDRKRERERERERFVFVGSPMLGGVRIICRVWRKTKEVFNPSWTFERERGIERMKEGKRDR